MANYTTMDWKKYIFALGSRDIRRIAAKVRRANLEIDAEIEIMRLLEQADARLLVGIFFDGADDTIEDGTSLVDGNVGIYSHGRWVTTRIDWAMVRRSSIIPTPGAGDSTRSKGTGRRGVAIR